jgi:rod shape-determining protein MreC
MRNIILLIQKYRNFLFFLFLESIALFFLFSATNSYHHYNYLTSSNSITAGLYNLQYSMTSYFSLRDINNQLMVENANLKNQLLNKEIVIGRKYVRHQDTIYKKNYLFKEVRVVNSQYKFFKNNLIINAGSNSGIEKKTGLIGTKGLLGIVMNVSSNYSSVRPVINPDFGLKILHKKTNSWGDLSWIPEENNFNNVFVKNIPIYTNINEGDHFITSGAEGLFPRGILIGRALSIKENIEKQTLIIKVKLEEDFSSLKVGFVVKNEIKEELDQHLNLK